MNKMFLLVIATIMIGCNSIPGKMPPQEVEVKLKVVSSENVKVSNNDITKTMTIQNHDGVLSTLSFISNKKAFIKLFSGLSTPDVTRLWNDFTVLSETTDIREVNVFISSPGGDAFSGLALADEIERAKIKGFTVNGHASGIVASAAVPVLSVCSNRSAAQGTIFMVHEAALWKWPGRETASDIRSQNELMDLLRDRYINILVKRTKLSKSEWCELEKKTTWFSAEKALEWGLIDKIE